jgi:NhaP-type Na+/H+ and K+/H+ antiporter
MASLDSVSIAIFLGAILVMAGILSSLLALRFGAPLLLVFLFIGMLAGCEPSFKASVRCWRLRWCWRPSVCCSPR